MEGTLHFRGHVSSDIPLASLGVTPDTFDEDVRIKVAEYLDLEANRLNGFVVEREPDGNMTVRPDATLA